jgi:hypothetical protein
MTISSRAISWPGSASGGLVDDGAARIDQLSGAALLPVTQAVPAEAGR